MNKASEFIPTRVSLLCRLKNWDDQESWRDFFETYWKLIYKTARKAGLTDAEAQDVVQETTISVMKSMPGFNYDPAKGSFKSWLLRLTGWRIIDQFRKRQRGVERFDEDAGSASSQEVIEDMADPAWRKMEVGWNEEWESNLIEAAVERVKKKVDPKQFQIFDLYVIKQMPVLTVARTLQINPGRVYLCKHRIGNLIRKEIKNLETKLI